MGTERINTGLRADLHRLVRIRAAEEGIPIKDVLDDVVDEGLKARGNLMGTKPQKATGAK